MSASGPVFIKEAPPEDQAKLVMYRLSKFTRTQCYELIRVNGKDMTTIVNGGYFDCLVPPGKVTITRSPRVAMGLGGRMFRPDFAWPVDLQVEIGKTYYIKFFIKTFSMDQALQVEIVPEIKALEDLKGFRKFEAAHFDMDI